MSRAWIAAPVGLIGFVLYVMLVVALGDHVRDKHWLVEFGYFVAVGLLWVIPARRLILWAGAAR
jgi:uncharacterized membrane protein